MDVTLGVSRQLRRPFSPGTNEARVGPGGRHMTTRAAQQQGLGAPPGLPQFHPAFNFQVQAAGFPCSSRGSENDRVAVQTGESLHAGVRVSPVLHPPRQ